MSNSRDPNYQAYLSMPVTQEEEEAWTMLSARESLEIQERESKKNKSSLGSSTLTLDPIDSSD